MAYMASSGNATVDAMGQFAITGNVTPVQWYRTVVRENGKPHLLAITILSDLVYWFRPTEIRDERSGQVIGWKKKFSGEKLQKSYKQYESMLGESRRTIKMAFDVLSDLGVIEREFKDVKITPQGMEVVGRDSEEDGDDAKKLYNVMFLELNVARLNAITYPEKPDENLEDKGNSEVVQNNEGGGTKFCMTSGKNLHEVSQNNVGPHDKNVMTSPQKNVPGGTKDCGTNTNNTSENINTEINSNLILSTTELVMDPNRPLTLSYEDEDETRQEEYNPNMKPNIILDFSMPIKGGDIFDVTYDMEYSKGIPYEWSADPERMQLAIQALADWNGRRLRTEEFKSDTNRIYVSVLKNLIEMALSKKIILNSGQRQISYKHVIDQINKIYHASHMPEFCLTIFTEMCIERYQKAYCENEIKNIDQYMKTLIWNTFDTYELDWDGFYNRTETKYYREKANANNN